MAEIKQKVIKWLVIIPKEDFALISERDIGIGDHKTEYFGRD